MKDIVLNTLEESIRVKDACIKNNLDLIVKAAQRIAECMTSGHKVMIFGNGGSAADAQHIAAELAVRYARDRPAIAALALTTDTSILTAAANDLGFAYVFSRQVEALGRPGDVAIGLSTSGRSANVVRGLEAARAAGLCAAALTGGDGGDLARLADPLLVVPSPVTARIQEMHIVLGHALCQALEGQGEDPQ
jgi:D-sedoheptulose 7-phosphate isomerase